MVSVDIKNYCENLYWFHFLFWSAAVRLERLFRQAMRRMLAPGCNAILKYRILLKLYSLISRLELRRLLVS
jgi:hypothetical protein